AFVFNNIMPEQAFLLRMDVNDSTDFNATYKITDQKKNVLGVMKPTNGYLSWEIKNEESKTLVDNDYTANIGGKMVYASAKEKKYYGGKSINLSNKYHTVLQKTKTNVLGSFVFENIKPDHDYYIGIDRADVPKGARVDMLSKEDTYIETLDTLVAERFSLKINSSQNKIFNDMA